MYHTLNLILYSNIKIPNIKEELIKWTNESHLVSEHNLEELNLNDQKYQKALKTKEVNRIGN